MQSSFVTHRGFWEIFIRDRNYCRDVPTMMWFDDENSFLTVKFTEMLTGRDRTKQDCLSRFTLIL